MASGKKIHGRSTVYNNIASDEKLAMVNPKNKELEEDFLAYLVSTDHAKSTIKQYEYNLHAFWCWNLDYNKNKFFVDIRKKDIARWQSHAINEYGWSPNRLGVVKSTMSSLGNYIEDILDDEYEDYKPIVRKIKSPKKVAVREKTILSEKELQKLLDHLINNEEYMKACVVSLAMNSGRRKAELPRFKVKYFDDGNIICNGGLYKTPEKVMTKGAGRLGKMLELHTIVKPFKPYLNMWLEKRKELGIRSEWLFVKGFDEKGRKEQLQTYTMDKWAKEFSDFLQKPFYWHGLRHYFTTKLVELNIPASVIQELVGWESADMVEIYNDQTSDQKFEKYFNANGVKEVKQGVLEEL